MLRADFPEVSISKIRFLEAEGLIEPERTPSGYRKFSHGDVERLRYVLTCQREHYLPLKVIREHLDAIAASSHPRSTGPSRRSPAWCWPPTGSRHRSRSPARRPSYGCPALS